MKYIAMLASASVLISANAFAIEQKIVLKNTVSQLTTPLTLNCSVCKNLRKQSDHVYLVDYDNNAYPFG